MLTLPDKLEPTNRFKEELKDIEIDVFEKIVISNNDSDIKKEETFSFSDLLINMPNIFNLPIKKQTETLKNIEPDPSLIDDSIENLKLPKISNDGLKPWIEYGNTVNTLPNFKKVALVISGIGHNKKISDRVYKIFESNVSMSFSPYTSNIKPEILAARELGHETYADIILSSKDYLKEDTGPMSLNLNLNIKDVTEKLNSILNTESPIGGVTIRDGYLEKENTNNITAVLNILKNRGLLIVDATSSSIIEDLNIEHLPRQKADIIIHKDMSKKEILNSLKKAETIAFNKGHVLVVIDPKPLILTSVYKWVDSFSPQVSYEEAKNINITKPFALVPVSNIVVE